ncbi:MAG: LysR family transcriptional regulator [Moritella sp.]|uniref:LysR family transcriptional regulator n=1 Tax=unclassified Moritella TaxID=2637987 RepID=UPI000156887A|nr:MULTISPECIES: LysR family transcriptional regulator [unclassified Moritella]EDM69236.1 transcriptional regulator, LysR family [Moritella sp. PE36]NQZ93914.1 LysR family transcriptional regulator [Moritella sp.]
MTIKKRGFTGQVSNIDLRTLRIFKTVVDCGGFSAAEVELNISRPAISIAISDLEQRLNLKLCQRGRTGFSLTEEGAEVYQSVLELLIALETFRTQVNAINEQLKGELNIGITDNLTTIEHMRLTDALMALKDLGPEIHINIKMMPPDQIEINVLDGRLHVGAVPELRLLPGLNYYPLYQEESFLYCSKDHPFFNLDDTQLTNAMISKSDAVVLSYQQTPEIKQSLQKLNSTASATDREGIAFLILTGRYIGYLPDHLARQWVTDRKVRAIKPDRFRITSSYSAVTRKSSRSNIILDTFMELLDNTAVK